MTHVINLRTIRLSLDANICYCNINHFHAMDKVNCLHIEISAQSAFDIVKISVKKIVLLSVDNSSNFQTT
jgi:hypothetical protein